MSEQNLTVAYGGVDITYVEYTNKWNFELRGRERNVDSLALAKEAIDKPELVKKKPFIRIPAFVMENDYSPVTKFVPVQVTSVAENPTYRTNVMFWIVDGKGKREQKAAVQVYADTPENRILMAQYIADTKTIDNLNNQLRKSLKQIETVEVPSE